MLGAQENIPNFQGSTSSYKKRSRYSEPGSPAKVMDSSVPRNSPVFLEQGQSIPLSHG